MNNEFTAYKLPRELYDKAAAGDNSSIQKIASFYKENNLPYKALEWLRYGGSKGFVECMYAAAATAISLSYELIMPEHKNEALCLEHYVEARYWMTRVYDEYDMYIKSEEERAKIEELFHSFDSRLGEYYYDYAIKNKKFMDTSLPKL